MKYGTVKGTNARSKATDAATKVFAAIKVEADAPIFSRNEAEFSAKGSYDQAQEEAAFAAVTAKIEAAHIRFCNQLGSEQVASIRAKVGI